VVGAESSLSRSEYAKINRVGARLESGTAARAGRAFLCGARYVGCFRSPGMLVILLALVCGADSLINDQVVAFARSKLGETVGDGQCSTLAAEALRQAGAKVRRGEHGSWGEELKSLLEAKPGDILQFDDTYFAHTSFGDDGTTTKRMILFPHHTAIVARVRKRGTKPTLVIVHQNVGDTKVVQEWTINIADKKRGTIKLYRPVAVDPPRGSQSES
jgi:hypothetical protein